MRDFRDAKAMAQTLRENLTPKATLTHSESLELVSQMLGLSDWNTLSAALQTEKRKPDTFTAGPPVESATYPCVPLRDLVPFPAATYPLFVGRKKTRDALNHAFDHQREVVLVVQREAAVDEPQRADVYDVGVLGRLLELEHLPNGTLKVLTQIYRRVSIRRFVGDSDGYMAEIAAIREGPIPAADDLIQTAVERFKTYASAKEIQVRQTWPPLENVRDPGRVADIISVYLAAPIPEKQSLLAILDPIARLKRVNDLMQSEA